MKQALVTAQRITGPAMLAESKMDLLSIICDQFGQELSRITLTNASCSKSNNFNLFSIGQYLINRWKLSGNSKGLELIKGKKKIRFDIIMRTKKGALYCVLMKREIRSADQKVAAALGSGTQMPLTQAHVMPGHPSFEAKQAMAHNLGWETSPSNARELVCQAYNEVKAKQKSIPEESGAEKTVEPNNRLYHNISTIKAPADANVTISKPVWSMLTDERTLMRFQRCIQPRIV